MKNKVNMLGRTMFETIAAISIMALITVGIVRLAGTIFYRYKLSRIGQQVVDIQRAINFRFMAAKSGYADLKWKDILVNERLVPDEMKVDGADYGKHAFGGKIMVGGVQIPGEMAGHMSRFFIIFENQDEKADEDIWQQACTALADKAWLQDGPTSFVAHCFGKCGADEAETLPVSGECICSFEAPADETAVAKCSTNGEDLSILWVFE